MRNGNRYEWIARDGKTPPPQACARLLDLVLRRGEFDRSRMRDAEQGELQARTGEALQRSISERAQAGVSRPEAKNDRPAAKASTRLAGESVEDHAVRLYAEAALDGEIKILLGTTRGRNDALNVAAVRLGGLVGAGGLSESMVSSALEQAAHGNGYVQKDGARERPGNHPVRPRGRTPFSPGSVRGARDSASPCRCPQREILGRTLPFGV
jgi:hypothetical protein